MQKLETYIFTVATIVFITFSLCFVVMIFVNQQDYQNGIVSTLEQTFKTHKSYTGTSCEDKKVTLFFADGTFLRLTVGDTATGSIQ